MNKTLSVNIGGIAFHIEENAFKDLNNYLEAIKGYFTASDGRDEIIQDIEARIAEMFQERLGTTRQVVIADDVEHVKSTLGKPEQYIIDEQQESREETSGFEERSEKRTNRRLYRDSDDRIIGGVCAGISHYIGLDPIWLRLAFAISFFVFGSGLLLYILLLIIMPKAITPSEKLEMKGEKVSLSNLKKSFHEETGTMASRAESGLSRFFDALGQLLLGLLKLVGKIIAGIFIVIGVIMLGSFALTLLAMLGVGGIAIPFFITDLFLDPWQQTLAMIAGFLVVGIPLLVLLSKAIQVLFKLNYSNKAMNWLALALWIIGLALGVLVGGSIAGEFKTKKTQRVEIPVLQPQGDTLYLEPAIPVNVRDESYYFSNDLDGSWDMSSDKDSLRIDDVQLDVIKSNSGEFELIQITSARGKSGRDAVNNARSITYRVLQEGSTLKFDETFMLTTGSRYRAQEIQLLLKVPEGKTVHLGHGMEDIIYDIQNVTNTYDGDMIDLGWTMTPDGLECIGCNLSSYGGRYRSQDKFNIHIDERGVNIKGIDDEDDTLIIDDDDVSIDISSEGIHIESN